MKISLDHRRILNTDGTPFFYLADTAWELFHRLALEDADHFLTVRAEQRFTVIQAVVLAEFDGLRTPNVYGEVPFIDLDPTRPNEAYFAHMDRVLRLGAEKGLTWGLLPTWGDKWTDQWGVGPIIFNAENARVYGRWLGARYRDLPLIWVMGGDRTPKSEAEKDIIRAMAAGIREGDGGSHLMTYHPSGGAASSSFFHDEPWLDFNMVQTGHQTSRMANDVYIATDYARVPAKPTLDAEPPYENHPDIAFGFQQPAPYFDDYVVRRAAWQAVCAGASGHTYGCHDIWQFLDEGREPVNRARTPWKKAIHLPGANQMRHLRTLMETLPFADLIPMPELASCMPSGGAIHSLLARDKSTAVLYFPDPGARTVNLLRFEGKAMTARWYDPSTGVSAPKVPVPAEPIHIFTPPANLRDAVLVLEAI